MLQCNWCFPERFTFGIFAYSCIFLIIFQGGVYVFTLLDWYAAGYSVMVISLCEVIVIGWIFGRCI